MSSKTSKRYKVTGAHPVLGHEPGSEFAMVIAPGLERFLLDTGALRVARSSWGKPQKPLEGGDEKE